MKKLLLSLSLVLAYGATQAQNLASENFDAFPATWTTTNQSAPVGTNLWGQPTAAVAAFPGGAYNGTANTSYAFANFNSTSNTVAGTISNWLITPTINIQNGDIVSFYTRKGLTGGTTVYADRMEVRLSTNGDFTQDPSLGATDVGDYTTLALSINPDLNTDDYPTDWTEYTYTVSGLSSATDCKIAFRYFVTDGGFTGNNSDYVAIDAFSVDRPLATDSFFASNYAVGPNPATDVVNVSTKNNNTINTVEITDVNGRVVKNVTVNAATSQINVADLNSGVYFLKASSENGVGTSKIVKK